MLDAITNCDQKLIRSSDTVAVRFYETKSGPRVLENMLSINFLELLVTLLDCIMCGKNIESRKSLVSA